MIVDLPPVNPDNAQPVALQAYRILERAVGDHDLPAGSKLPAERELAERLRISRSTLRQVLGALADAGRVEAHPQRGWFVAGEPTATTSTPIASDPPDRLISFTESARRRGLRPGARVLSSIVRPITLSEQELFQAAPGAPVLEVERLRTLDDTPVCVNTSRVLVPRVPGIQDVDLTDASLYTSMWRVAGVRPERADYAVHADAADAGLAELLGVPTGAPVLVGEDVAYSGDGLALVQSRSIYRADAYVFRATIRS